MKRRLLVVSLVMACILITSWNIQDNDWALRRESDGIKVYTRKSPGATVKEVRVTGVFTNSLSSIVSLLQDKESHPSWIYHCKSAKELKHVHNLEQYCYQEIELPWPCEDRDMVTNYKIQQDSSTKAITIYVTGVPDYIPEVPGLVRIRKVSAKWMIRPRPDKKVDVEYVVNVDPGGNIPAWLINMGVTEGPYDSLIKMKAKLQEKKYAQATLSYIKNQ
jgi:hypothetical protein